MNTRYPYLFALALTLPLSSCRFVGLRPDFTALISSFKTPVVDEAYAEDLPASSSGLATAPSSTAPASAPPVLQLPELAPAPAATPAQPASSAPALVSQQQPATTAPAAAPPAPAAPRNRSWLASQLSPSFSDTPGSQQAAVHVVQPGDSLSRIARIHKVSLHSLAAVNGIDLQHALIKPGQKLIIPAASTPASSPRPASTPKTGATAPATPPPVATTPPGQYRVCAGDTLYRIARQHGISLQALMQANTLNEESARSVRVGTLLTIPSRQ